jgi:hypothetical protein
MAVEWRIKRTELVIADKHASWERNDQITRHIRIS